MAHIAENALNSRTSLENLRFASKSGGLQRFFLKMGGTLNPPSEVFLLLFEELLHISRDALFDCHRAELLSLDAGVVEGGLRFCN